MSSPVSLDRPLSALATPSPKQPQPSVVYEWVDAVTGAKGYLVLASVVNQVSGGGIFMKAGATLEETTAIAWNMAKKFTVTNPQIGGAKAGIDFDHTDPRAKDVLERFIVDCASFLRSVWVTAGDLNTDDTFIESVIQTKVGLPTCQATLGRRYAEATGGSDLSTQLAKLISFPASPYFPLIEGAVGFGLARSVELALQFAGKQGTRPTVAIQGFGAVGTSLAYYIHTRGIGVVTVVADRDGVLYNEEGLDIPSILDARQRVLTHNTTGLSKDYIAKNLVAWVDDSFGTVVHGSMPLAQLANDTTRKPPTVLCPCATRYVLTPEVAHDIFDRPDAPAFVVPGANNAYGIVGPDGSLTEDKGHVVLKFMESRGVVVVPDWVANSGTAQLFHVGLTRDFSVPAVRDAASTHLECASAVLDAVQAPIDDFLSRAFTSYADKDPVKLWKGCEALAKERLTNPRPFVASPEGECGGLTLSRSVYALPPAEGLAPAAARYERLMYISQLLNCEVVQGPELGALLTRVANPVVYDGFEPSGKMHIAQGLLKTFLVNEFTAAGFTYVLWVADWFAMLNNKMGGDMDKIAVLGHYFVEIWKSCGMDTSRVQFLWASKEFDARSSDYWGGVMRLATKVSLDRAKKCTQIMGRKDSDTLSVAQMMYPIMQAQDIAFLGVDVCQLGLDQRKVNMLAREQSESLGMSHPPVIYSHPMLPGLKAGAAKMSKSDPDCAVFMEDSPDEVRRKFAKAFCPAGEEENPVLAYFKFIVFPFAVRAGVPVRVPSMSGREEGDHGVLEFTRYEELVAAYVSGAIHPVALKEALAAEINSLLEPTRRHFATNPAAAALKEHVRVLTAAAAAVPAPTSA